MAAGKDRPRIGVLAVQGAFAEHCLMLQELGVEAFEIRRKEDLVKPADGFVFPGGESTVQTKLIHDLGLSGPLKLRIQTGVPVFGTCAGLLLLAKEIANDRLDNFGLMDITAVRNAYGRQLGSFFANESFAGQTIPMPFIRAPYIQAVDDEVEVLAVVQEKIVAARQNNRLVTAFHPEITDDFTVHQYFLEMVRQRKEEAAAKAAVIIGAATYQNKP